MTEYTIQEYKTRTGDAFVANVSKNVASGGTLNIHIKIPDSAEKRIVITNIGISSPDGKVAVDVPYGFTVDSAGIVEVPQNRLFGDSRNSVAEVYQDSTCSGVIDTHTTYVGTGTTGGGTVVGGQATEVNATLLQGEDFIISCRNTSGSNARDIAITVTYYETSPRAVSDI